MNTNNFLKIISFIILTFIIMSCDTDYINDPDNPNIAPSYQLLINSEFDLAYELNDEFTGGRGTLGIAQYWAQTEYTNENRYSFRTNQVDDWWEWPYRILTDLKEIIELNENPTTKVSMSAYGDNNNQIQVSRILMAFTFSKLVDTFGDVPYWSYSGRNNKDFQGLKLKEGISTPKYTKAETIYKDLLSELLDAANKINEKKISFNIGDRVYGGDSKKWIKFAHSIRLRLASHIREVNPTLAKSVYNESKSKAFSNNTDNAYFKFGNDDNTGGPWHNHFTVQQRRDFAPSISFISLLYNEKGPFISLGTNDPRIYKYFQKSDSKDYTGDKIIGLPYGFGDAAARAELNEGKPSDIILVPDYNNPLLTYSEIEFIKAEFENWNQANYEKAVLASQEQWGVSSEEAEAYVKKLPPASEETVLTQKYIALYMDGLEAWTLYRATGYPKTLTKPGDTYFGLTFKPSVDYLNQIPSRITYPQDEQLLNKNNWQTAINSLLPNGNGDRLNSKIFWQKK